MITDNNFSIETPEGTDLVLHPAGIGVRSMATLIDWLIKVGIIVGVQIVLAFAGKAGQGIFLIFLFLQEWFYPVLFEVFYNGQTPGKKSFKIRVVSEDGTPLTVASSLLRNLLRVVDFLPFSYLTGIIVALSNRRFQRIGDLVAGTMVIYVPEKVGVPKIDVDGYEPIPIEMSTDEQRSIVNFAERCSTLTESRQRELANILQPILGTAQPVLSLRRIAKRIVEPGKKDSE